jgi:NADPH:quinone reductase-like Zn-dependent oxidoreductase
MQQPSASTSATTSRAVQLESFGGPEVLNLREVPAPQAGSGQIRVRVTAAGLNPMDWFMTSDAETATRFGLSLPSGFGTDYAGVVDQVGDGVTEFAAGDRVFGGALSRAVADYVVIDVAGTIAAGQLRVPIAASFPVEQIRAAVELQASRHVHGKVVIDL